MKVFISWSGPHAQVIAKVLTPWLDDVFELAQPFMSTLHISGGERGLNRIAKELEGARFGVVVTTLNNQNAPWLNYEAGALSKVVDDAGQRVMPLLVDLTDAQLTSPLKQFQAAPLDEEGVKVMVASIGGWLFDWDQLTIDKKFRTYWPQLKEQLDAIEPPTNEPEKEHHRPEPELIDEILTVVRNISRTLDRSWPDLYAAVERSRSARRFTGPQLRALAKSIAEEMGAKVWRVVVTMPTPNNPMTMIKIFVDRTNLTIGALDIIQTAIAEQLGVSVEALGVDEKQVEQLQFILETGDDLADFLAAARLRREASDAAAAQAEHFAQLDENEEIERQLRRAEDGAGADPDV